jgi:Mn2+/Fe2+ NRAMP family transporter
MISRNSLRTIGPGLIVAATGVGAGDLAAASIVGSKLGLAVLWAVLVGAFLKFVLNEGLARWQLATGSTLVEGCVAHLGRSVQWAFLGYLIVWSFLVAAALMSAIGVTSHAMFPLAGTSPEAAQVDKIIYGIAHSLLAVALVLWGGFRVFDSLMGVLVALMFVIVVMTAVAIRPSVAEVMRGLVVPVIPVGGVAWTIALMGGIGGTVTVLSYGYWIREVGRHRPEDLAVCRIDLACAYGMTAVFGLGMVIIGDSLTTMEGSGARLMVQIAGQLDSTFGAVGPLAKWAFLVGAWAAVFTSLLGVWQSTPYLFADLWRLMGRDHLESSCVDTSSFPYRAYLCAIASAPIIGLVAINFQAMMKVYAIVGALFIPMLAAVLLVLNGRASFIGEKYRNTWRTSLVLVGALLLFAFVAAIEVRDNFFASG